VGRLATAWSLVGALVRSGWGAPSRHILAGTFAALPVSFLVLLVVALSPLGVAFGTVVMAVIQVVLSLAIAGWQRKGGFRS
jgi:hypothetical protein